MAGSETNINRARTPNPQDPECPSSPVIGRLWRRMSEPVNDLPKQRTKKRKQVYVRQQNNNNNNNTSNNNNNSADNDGSNRNSSNNNNGTDGNQVGDKDKTNLAEEFAESFTRNAMKSMKLDVDQSQNQPLTSGCPSRNDSTELLKILDDTHQQFRSNLLRGIHQKQRRSSVSSAGGIRDSPAHSELDLDNEAKFRKPKRAEDMLVFKIDHASKESIEASGAQDDFTEASCLLVQPHGLRESRSNPMLMDIGQIKELEIIEEQNELDNLSESGEEVSALVQVPVDQERGK